MTGPALSAPPKPGDIANADGDIYLGDGTVCRFGMVATDEERAMRAASAGWQAVHRPKSSDGGWVISRTEEEADRRKGQAETGLTLWSPGATVPCPGGELPCRRRAKIKRTSAHLAHKGAIAKLALFGPGEGALRTFVVTGVQDDGDPDGIWLELGDPRTYDWSREGPEIDVEASEVTFQSEHDRRLEEWEILGELWNRGLDRPAGDEGDLLHDHLSFDQPIAVDAAVARMFEHLVAGGLEIRRKS